MVRFGLRPRQRTFHHHDPRSRSRSPSGEHFAFETFDIDFQPMNVLPGIGREHLLERQELDFHFVVRKSGIAVAERNFTLGGAQARSGDLV